MQLLGRGPIAGLRLHRKGANKRHRSAVLPLAGLPQTVRPATAGLVPTVPAAGGRLSQPGERVQDVTTVSSADHSRRDFLYIATGAIGAVGAAAALVPLIAQMNPDASTIAAGAPIEVDLAPIADGQIIKVFWRSKPIFISHRTKHDIELAQNVDVNSLPDPAPDSARIKQGHDQWLG